MNLIKFLLIGALISIIFGELGKYPFGSSVGISLLDIFVSLTDIFFIIWVIVTKYRINIPILFKWIIGFWVIGLISLIFSLTLFPPLAVLGGSAYLIRFIIYSSIFLISFNLKKDGLLNIEKLFNLLRNIGFIFIFLGFLQLIFFPNFDFLTEFGFDPHQNRLTSTFLDPNFTGIFLVFVLAANVYFSIKEKSKLNIFFLLINLIAIILTYSRTAYLMLGIYLIIMGFPFFLKFHFKKKIISVIISIFILSAILIIFPRFLDRIKGGLKVDKSASERLISWDNSLKIFENSLILGVGFNNYRIAQESFNLLRTFSPDGGHSGSGSDSSFLLILATTGFLGILIYLGLWLIFFKNIYKNNNLLALFVSFLIASQFINGLFYIPLMIWYFSFMGLGWE